MLPLWDTEPHKRAPVLTALLIAACLGVFGYELSLLWQSRGDFEAWVVNHALVPGRLLSGWRDWEKWLTVVTSMFLHGGVGHVLGNCWFLWIFGNNVEDRLGFFGFGLFYLVTGAAAAAAQVLVDPDSAIPMVGASGAISGVLGAYLVMFPRSWIVSLVPWIVPILPIPAVVFLLLWFYVQAQAGVGALMGGTVEEAGVAWFAHAGGFVAGAAIAWMLPGPKRRR